jgi:hypothetical protein
MANGSVGLQVLTLENWDDILVAGSTQTFCELATKFLMAHNQRFCINLRFCIFSSYAAVRTSGFGAVVFFVAWVTCGVYILLNM